MKPIVLKKINNNFLTPEEIISDVRLLEIYEDFSLLESEKVFFSAGNSRLHFSDTLLNNHAYRGG